jgi:hypothetical protein
MALVIDLYYDEQLIQPAKKPYDVTQYIKTKDYGVPGMKKGQHKSSTGAGAHSQSEHLSMSGQQHRAMALHHTSEARQTVGLAKQNHESAAAAHTTAEKARSAAARAKVAGTAGKVAGGHECVEGGART